MTCSIKCDICYARNYCDIGITSMNYQRVREDAREMKDFKLVEKPFDWNDNLSEVALEDFAIALRQKSLYYGTCQTIGMALAKLQLLEKQGAKVKEQIKGGQKNEL